MLSAVAGMAGVGLAWLFLHALLQLNPGDIPRMGDARLDLRVMGFVLFVTMLTSVLFGMLPSLSSTRINLAEFLQGTGMRGVLGDRRRVRHGLAVAQIALLVVLLTGTGLLVRSYANVLSVPTGFSATTVTANVQMSSQSAPRRAWRLLREPDRPAEVESPRAEAVGVVNELPLSTSESLATLSVEGYPNKNRNWWKNGGLPRAIFRQCRRR